MSLPQVIELFCVGTELTNPALSHPQKWRQLIAQVRAHYSGPLTYADNWWEEYDRIAFWDALDYMGATPSFRSAKPTL